MMEKLAAVSRHERLLASGLHSSKSASDIVADRRPWRTTMTTSYGTGAGTHLLCSRRSATWASPPPLPLRGAVARRSRRFRLLAAGFATRRARPLRRLSAPARAAPSLAPLLATHTCLAWRRWRRSTSRAGRAARHASTPLLRNFRACVAADWWWCWRLELQGEVLRQSQGHQEPSGLAAGAGRALSTNHISTQQSQNAGPH